jgi:electron transfer flavoprotein beta subunit
MKVLVCIKQVPDTTQVEVDEKTGILKRDGVASKINPYDLYAVETGVRIARETSGTSVVLTMGPPQAEEVLREALCMGVDDAYLLTDRRFGGADVLATSYTLSQGIRARGRHRPHHLRQADNGRGHGPGRAEIAEFLSIPHATNVSRIVSLGEALSAWKSTILSIRNSRRLSSLPSSLWKRVSIPPVCRPIGS